ncbi:Copper amine oxidase 1, partial [Fusarium oxysporum f. sp. albedinis]
KMTSKACPQRYEGILYLSSSSAQVEAMPVALSPALSGEARPAAAVSASVSSLQEGEPLEDPPSGLSGHAGSGRDDTSCIVVSIETVASSAVSSAKPSTQGGTSPVASSSTASVAPTLRYDDPQAIYRRYVAARDAWYKAQPRGSVKTNQQYRRALGLPLRYDKASYQWCFDWKQMGKLCTTPTGSRDWSKEEMMAYLDWSKAEDDRVEAQVAAEMESNPFSSRRGMRDIWEAAENDGKEQQELYSA